jgi:uncharacterized membrane protein YqaE (UPF0057 family)
MPLKSDKSGKKRSVVFVVALVIIAILLPPLAVLLDQGCGEDFVINILLTILGWFPGIIHAFYILAVREQKDILPRTHHDEENPRTEQSAFEKTDTRKDETTFAQAPRGEPLTTTEERSLETTIIKPVDKLQQ